MTAHIRQRVEELIQDPINEKFLEDLWIKMVKIGFTIPSSDEVLHMLEGFCVQNDAVKLTGMENGALCAMLGGLSSLAQIALIRERM